MRHWHVGSGCSATSIETQAPGGLQARRRAHGCDGPGTTVSVVPSPDRRRVSHVGGRGLPVSALGASSGWTGRSRAKAGPARPEKAPVPPELGEGGECPALPPTGGAISDRGLVELCTLSLVCT